MDLALQLYNHLPHNSFYILRFSFPFIYVFLKIAIVWQQTICQKEISTLSKTIVPIIIIIKTILNSAQPRITERSPPFENSPTQIVSSCKMSKRQLNVETLETEPPSAACISSLNLFDPVLLSARFLFDGIRNRLRSVTRHKWILYPRRINPSSPPISVDGLIRKLRRFWSPRQLWIPLLPSLLPKKRKKETKKKNSRKFKTKPINSALFFLEQECFKFKRA